MNRLGNEAVELKEKDIEKYLNEALPELNIRLWTDMCDEEIADMKIADANMDSVINAITGTNVSSVVKSNADVNIDLIINSILYQNKILWLESITLTSYAPYDARRNIQRSSKESSHSSAIDSSQSNASDNTQSSSQINIPHRNIWRTINRLMGKLALKLPFTLKKYRKERR